MKRALLGAVWFAVFWVLFSTIGLTATMSFQIDRILPPDADAHQMAQATLDFMATHAGLISAVRWTATLLSLAVVVYGSWKGILPGTRRRAAAPQ